MSTIDRQNPSSPQWPPEGLEAVGYCPICSSMERICLYTGLQDKVFQVAPGQWSLWQCSACGSAYLDPRPTRDTIAHAYESYYTHHTATVKAPYSEINTLRQWRRRLVNGYTNWRFSTRESPASRVGPLLHWVLPIRYRLEHEYRHLWRRVPSGGRVLDIGCANGAFLQIAKTCGWQVTGVEPDPQSAANARTMGLDVHLGGLDVFDDQSELFDIITICHVIEHVHEPMQVLADIHRLLKPGGQLWLETPNMESIGHRVYRSDWRGLEPPRHLCLFSSASLRRALNRTGFRMIERLTGPSPLFGIVAASEAIMRHEPYGTPIRLSIGESCFWFAIGIIQFLWPAKREFLLVSARK